MMMSMSYMIKVLDPRSTNMHIKGSRNILTSVQDTDNINLTVNAHAIFYA